MARLECENVRNLQSVAVVGFDLLGNIDDDKLSDGIGRGKLVDCRIFRCPVGRRIKLLAKLVRGQRIARRLEPMLCISEPFPLFDETGNIAPSDGGTETRLTETFPDGDRRRDGVGRSTYFADRKAAS